MLDRYLVCNAVVVNKTATEIMSPSIGRAELCIDVGQVLLSGQVIGEIRRLNQRFKLSLPESCTGKVVSVKDHNRIIPLAYGEMFLSLEQLTDVKSQHVSETTSVINVQHSVGIDAPMDGMFYLSASPHDPPFVKTGDVVSPGQTVGLIEVMKSFYPLKYQGVKPATILSIDVKNAVPVTCGMKLFAIDLAPNPRSKI